MNGIDIAIILSAVAIVLVGIIYNLRRGKKAKECGTVACAGCSSASSCCK